MRRGHCSLPCSRRSPRSPAPSCWRRAATTTTTTSSTGEHERKADQEQRRQRRRTITVGSKNFTEEFILGEIYAQALQAAGYKVKRT